MKTPVKILMVFLAMIFSVSSGFGQNFSQKFSPGKQMTVKIDKNMLPAGFMAGLQWQKFLRQYRNNDKSTRSFTYHIDTAVVYSNFINPQRYVYFYDSAGNKVVSLVERLINEKWQYLSKDSATYDSVGNRLMTLSMVWNNGSWVNSSLSVSYYTLNHNVVDKINKTWLNDRWVPSDSTHYTYDENGNTVASFSAGWIDSTATWESKSFHLYSYDSVNNLKLSLFELWADSVWMDNQMVQYVYDSASNLIHGLVQNRGDTNWVNFYQEKYTYNSTRNRLSYTGQKWNDSVWINDQHYDYTYNNLNQLASGVGQNWADSVWVNFEKGQYTYDTYGGIETYLYQQWNDTVWENISLSQYNYDSSGNAYLGNYYSWDTTGSMTQNSDGVLQIFYNYSSAIAYFTGYQVEIKYNTPLSTGIGNLKDFVSQYTCAPNPAIDHTTIRLGLNTGESISLNLYSLTGKKVFTIYNGMLNQGSYRFEVPVSQLPSGIYLASLISGNHTKTIKIVVRK